MRRAEASTTREHKQFIAESFLRSINLIYDAEAPERIQHFQPTSKTVPLARGLVGLDDERSYFVVAPYGSGKSLTLSYLLHLIENRPDSHATLKTIEQRLQNVSPELGQWAKRRRKSTKRGLVIALHGHCLNLATSFHDATLKALRRHKLGRHIKSVENQPCNSIDDVAMLLDTIRDKASACDIDRISILWDEAGRHIETLVSEGRTAELADIQTLAEIASRSRSMPTTFAVSLHQGLLHYAGRMSQSVRSEWLKISARFQEIQYVDDSKEIYRLVSEVIAFNRHCVCPLPKTRIRQIAHACREAGVLAGFAVNDLTQLIEQAYPLEPVAFYLLPLISARVAQNERTLFTFLYAADLSAPLSVADLYDYFSSAMRADTAVGGTYKQWLETQSALAKTDDDPKQVQVLKTCCLLSLGASGERARAGRDLVALALTGFGDTDHWTGIINGLVKRNLLLHRRHSDELSVWHGTDVDLRGRLEEEKHRQAATFDLCRWLQREAPPRAWRPLEHNSVHGISRYWSGEYIPTARMESIASGKEPVSVPVGCDGRLLYLVAEDADQLKIASTVAGDQSLDRRIMTVMPTAPLQVRDAALEVFCLSQMLQRGDLIGRDPLVLPELQQMLDDARAHLQRILDRLLSPSNQGPKWTWQGRDLHVVSPSSLRKALSTISNEIFPLTPRIHNELIVRRRPSATIVNSRKKLLLGILERNGQEAFGIRGYFPDYSMYRTVLLHTRLYNEEDGRWGYIAPSSKQLEPGIAAIWHKLQDFFGTPSDTAKEPAKLFTELMEPPFGIREGLLPILFSAGLRAFAQVVSLTRNGSYLTDIMPDDIEDLCLNPKTYSLRVLNLDDQQMRYLRRVHRCFSPISDNVVTENDLIRLCYDAILGWRFQLPSAALTTSNLDRRTKSFQDLLRQDINPVGLLLEDLPRICEATPAKLDKLMAAIQQMKMELESVAKSFVDKASTSIRRALTRYADSTGGSLRDLTRQWACSIADGDASEAVPAVAKGLLTRMQMDYDGDELLADSISQLLVGRSLTRWDDSTAITFDNRLREMVHHTEQAVIETCDQQSGTGNSDRIVKMLQQRVDAALHDLIQVAGRSRAEDIIKMLLEQKQSSYEVQHGNT